MLRLASKVIGALDVNALGIDRRPSVFLSCNFNVLVGTVLPRAAPISYRSSSEFNYDYS